MAIETTHYVYFSYHFKVIWKNIHLYLSQTSLWKILKEMGIPDYLTCLLRNLYAGQEATIRTGHGKMDCFKIEKGVHQGQNAGLDESQAGIKIAGRNINSFRYADDSTLLAERKEELKSLLMNVNEESERVGLKHSIQKTKIMASTPIVSWQIEGEQVEAVTDLFSWAPKSPWMVTAVTKLNETCFLGGNL